MRITKHVANEFLPLLQALAEGKQIQRRYIDRDANPPDCYAWNDADAICTDIPVDRWRIKPEPNLRPWKPEEVPVGAMVRNIGTRSRYLITEWCCARPSEIVISCCVYSFETMLRSYEHSLDHGKTWLPCGVMS
jgi:hypothetical protein